MTERSFGGQSAMTGSPHPPAGRSSSDISQTAFPAVPTFTPSVSRASNLPSVRQDLPRAVHAPSLVSHIELGPIDSSVATARLHTRMAMQEWRFSEDFTADTELLVSELVTNAVLASRALQLPLPSPVHLWLKAGFQRVTITVWDGNEQPPVLKEDVPADEEHGRGLMLVDFFASGWGWFEPARIGGKCVWCEVVQQPDGQK
jgi:anti-sigma regulatory factor (Ser/Thr protein kinase)